MGLTRHDGLGVYGSGLYWSKKNYDVIGDVPFFGGTSGTAGAGAVRCDGGTFGMSGSVIGVSTRLSSIYYMTATLGRTTTSGLLTVNAVASGNGFDIYTIYRNTSTMETVASISTPIYWFAAGT